MINNKQVKTRFAPSPTGYMHLGSVRAALLPFLLARQTNGIFLLRIDDTDTERSKIEYENDILQNLKWLNIDFDETFKQSSRSQIYQEIFDVLHAHNVIYECFETPEELENIKNRKRLQKKAPIITRQDCSSKTGTPCWRFDPNLEHFEFDDIIQGHLSFGKDWSDPVIRKSDGGFTYMFTSVVDDILSNITHIIRGEDHIANTATQLAIGNKISQIKFGHNWDVKFAHFSFFLNISGEKMSKRNLNNNLSSWHFLEPMTFWSTLTTFGTNKNQIFSLNFQDYINHFDLHSFSKSKHKFDENILLQTNKKIFHLKPCPDGYNANVWNILKNNANSMEEMQNLIKHFEHFLQHESDLKKTILENQTIEDIASNLGIPVRDCYKTIYQKIFQQDFGPQISDLFPLIQQISRF